MKSVCVFAGAGSGRLPQYSSAAAALGRLLARRGITLVYGGGRTGLMGAAADAALKAGGKVVGVIPKGLTGMELDHKGLSRMIVTRDMHSRKAEMHRLSEGFIALPGGIGTFDELFEALCWSQLGFHDKPCGLLNIKGYYDPLLKLVRNAVSEGFVADRHFAEILASPEPARLVSAMNAARRKA